MRKWISVKDRLPAKDFEPCFVTYRNYKGELRSEYVLFERMKIRGEILERWIYPFDEHDVMCHADVVY